MPDSEKKIIEKSFTIRNALGLHARPAALFVQTANRFRSEITVRKGRQKANGKSIMGIMTLAVQQGSTIIVKAEGLDAEAAIAELTKLVENNFGE